ncbi:hypothetical protein ACP4OV_004968 [Aristida adscensionis]
MAPAAMPENLIAPALPAFAAAAAEEAYPGRLRRCVEAAVKGFAIGSGLKGGLALLSALLRLRALLSRRSTSAAAADADAVWRAVKETVRHGLFLGAFAGSYVSVDEGIAAVWGHKRTARWRSSLAGLIAGPTMLLTGTHHTSLATYILVRAGVLIARCGIKSRRFAKICKPLTWSHGDIFLMCVSSAQIASAYILYRDSFSSSYKAFLSKQIGKDPVVLEGLKELVNSDALSNIAGIEKYYKSVGVELKLDPKLKVPCSILHVYVPVYIIPALFRPKHLVKSPCSQFGKTLLGIARSSLFLSVYCASEWGWTCLLFRAFQSCNIPLLVLGTFPTGLALLIEKKSRRMEISLYCLARAIESFSTCMADAGLCPSILRVKRVDVVVFSVAASIIMHCYAQERAVFRSKYLDVLDWVFGVPAPYVDER